MDLTFPLFVGDLDLNVTPLEEYLGLGKGDTFFYKMFSPVTDVPSVYFFYPIFYKDRYQDLESLSSIDKKVQDAVRLGKCKILVISQYEGWSWSFYEQLIDYIKLKYNFTNTSFAVISNNKIKSTQYKSIFFNYWEYFSYSNNILKEARLGKESIFTNAVRDHKFVCLNNRPHAHRYAVFTGLYPYCNNSLLSFRECRQQSLKIFEKEFPRFYKKWNELTLIKQVPRLLPQHIDPDQHMDNPINHNSAEMFYQSYLHVVVETHIDTIFFSEKIYKPVKYFQPFVLINAVHALKHFRDLGYKTFNDYIDESYDDIENNELRILKAIESISKFISRPDLNSVLKEMYPIFEHNHNTLVKNAKSTRTTLYKNISKMLLSQEMYDN
jgi:hypothetical protein